MDELKQAEYNVMTAIIKYCTELENYYNEIDDELRNKIHALVDAALVVYLLND